MQTQFRHVDTKRAYAARAAAYAAAYAARAADARAVDATRKEMRDQQNAQLTAMVRKVLKA